MNLQTKLWLTFIILLGIDALLITPYALTQVEGLEEANIWKGPLSEKYGVIIFYLAFPFEAILLYGVFFLIEKGLTKISKKQGEVKIGMIILGIVVCIQAAYISVRNIRLIVLHSI